MIANIKFTVALIVVILLKDLQLRWLEIVCEIFFTRKQFTFIHIITAFMLAT